MMPTKEHLEAIKAMTVQGKYVRSHAGSIVWSLIEQLNNQMVNVTEGTIEAGPFLERLPLPAIPFEEALTILASLASVNMAGVEWGWKIDNMARVHFAPLDHLPQG